MDQPILQDVGGLVVEIRLGESISVKHPFPALIVLKPVNLMMKRNDIQEILSAGPPAFDMSRVNLSELGLTRDDTGLGRDPSPEIRALPASTTGGTPGPYPFDSLQDNPLRFLLGRRLIQSFKQFGFLGFPLPRIQGFGRLQKLLGLRVLSAVLESQKIQALHIGQDPVALSPSLKHQGEVQIQVLVDAKTSVDIGFGYFEPIPAVLDKAHFLSLLGEVASVSSRTQARFQKIEEGFVRSNLGEKVSGLDNLGETAGNDGFFQFQQFSDLLFRDGDLPVCIEDLFCW